MPNERLFFDHHAADGDEAEADDDNDDQPLFAGGRSLFDALFYARKLYRVVGATVIAHRRADIESRFGSVMNMLCGPSMMRCFRSLRKLV